MRGRFSEPHDDADRVAEIPDSVTEIVDSVAEIEVLSEGHNLAGALDSIGPSRPPRVRILRMAEQARIALRCQEPVQALAIFSHAYALCNEETVDDATRWLIHSGLGSCYAMLGQPQRAAQEMHQGLETALRSQQSSLIIRSHLELIELHHRQGRYGTALEHLRKTIQLTDLRRMPLAQAHRALGLDLHRGGHHSAALDSLEIAACLLPSRSWVNDLPLVETLVLACIETNRLERARELLELVRVGSLRAPEVMLLGLEALTELVNGDLDVVLDLASKAQTDSGNSLLDWVIARAHNQRGQPDEVLKDWLRADTTAYNRQLRLEIARALEAIGDYEQAYAFELAASTMPTRGDASAPPPPDSSTTDVVVTTPRPTKQQQERTLIQLLAERDQLEQLGTRLASEVPQPIRSSVEADDLMTALARHLEYLRTASAALENAAGIDAGRVDVQDVAYELLRHQSAPQAVR